MTTSNLKKFNIAQADRDWQGIMTCPQCGNDCFKKKDGVCMTCWYANDETVSNNETQNLQHLNH